MLTSSDTYGLATWSALSPMATWSNPTQDNMYARVNSNGAVTWLNANDVRTDISAAPSVHNHSTNDITAGILPVAQGGTGLSSVTSGRILFGGSDALSTSDNLYWDNGSERLGIGTTTPGSKLQVNGNVAIGYNGSTEAHPNGLVVSGSVGIGTTKNYSIHQNALMFADKTPKMIFRPGNADTNYEELILMENKHSEEAGLRRLGFILKFGNPETQQHENDINKMGGLVLDTESDWAASPKLHLVTSNQKRLTVTNDGSIGIGTTTPQKKLVVVGDIEFTGDLYKNGQTFNGSNWSVSGNNVYRNAGNVGIGTTNPNAKLQVQCFKAGSYSSNHNDYLVAYTGFGIGWDGNQWRTPGDGANNAAGMIASSIGSGKMYFYTFPSTGTGDQAINDSELNNYRRLTITNNGYVGIGTTSPEALLHVNGSVKINSSLNATQVNVNGTIYAKQIRVRQNVPNSDHVFKQDYNLMPLRDVEQFIREYGHLPEVPSAIEFQENGYLVGDMDDLLLRKVEELTLYIIDINKRFEALEFENMQLKTKLIDFISK